MHLAAMQGVAGLVNLLLEEGADPAIKNEEDEVAIAVANKDAVKKLIEEFNQKRKKQKIERKESDREAIKPGKEEE